MTQVRICTHTKTNALQQTERFLAFNVHDLTTQSSIHVVPSIQTVTNQLKGVFITLMTVLEVVPSVAALLNFVMVRFVAEMKSPIFSEVSDCSLQSESLILDVESSNVKPLTCVVRPATLTDLGLSSLEKYISRKWHN